jgi:hypothetical protein
VVIAVGVVVVVVTALVMQRTDDSTRSPRLDRPADAPTTTAIDENVHTRTFEIVPTDANPTDAQRSEADDLVARVEAAEQRHGWGDPSAAAADGYRPLEGDPEHWFDPAALTDGVAFDPDRPEFLMYHDGHLAGMMFVAESLDLTQPAPPGAPLLRWHVHVWGAEFCVRGGLVPTRRTDGRPCPAGETATWHSPLMVHVWTMAGMDPFALDMAPGEGGDHADAQIRPDQVEALAAGGAGAAGS